MSAAELPGWEFRDLLREVVQRSDTVEVSVLPRSAGAAVLSHRVRLLECSETRVVIAQPDRLSLPQGLRIGVRVQITACAADRRCEASAAVLRVINFALPNQSSVRAAVLSLPGECRDAQRRKFFRVDVAGLGIEPVMLHPKVKGRRVADVPPIACVMLNLSAGGLGVVAAQDVESLERFREFECLLKAPGESTLLKVNAELVNMQHRTATTVYLGLRFVIGDNGAGRRLGDRLHRWTVELQRQQIQRRLEGGDKAAKV